MVMWFFGGLEKSLSHSCDLRSQTRSSMICVDKINVTNFNVIHHTLQDALSCQSLSGSLLDRLDELQHGVVYQIGPRQHLLLCLHFKQLPSSQLAPFLTQNSPLEKGEVNWCLPPSQVHPSTPPPPPPHLLLPSPPSSSTLSCNPLPTQAAVKVRRFYMVRLQCPCPISLWSEAGLNMPILILPNKLNHAVGRRGEGEC